MPQPICDTTDRRMNLQSLHEERNAHQENGARIKMRAQNRTKVMAAIVATGDNRFSFASHVHAARECADGGGGAAHRSAHRGGPLSRDRPRPSEPLCGT